ncbi:hypothetical protein A9Z42_0056740 [Trichoderma parareesei]|uniref:Uncharacterized protein n=1 Tax=Trichoderma parareesei TaxID=858221 RepID=A0A2H2ZK40_TRIPA|nr:hypothetical protein A9Z42_0056740 [Trichoderma parareesei]
MASNPYRFQSVDPRNDTQVLYSDQHKGERDDNGVDKLHRVITYAYRIASHVCLAIRNLKQLIDVIAKKTDEEGGAGESATMIDLERGHVRHID